jgi:hydroxyacylglutathione hydrolase
MALAVHQFPCLEDNYGFLARDEATGTVACIDPPDGEAVLAALQASGWRLDYIVNTHWHGDHTGGNDRLRAATGALVIGPAEIGRRSVVDRVVRPGDRVSVGITNFDVLDTAGHTAGHVSYYAWTEPLVFVGDTLFAMGCGRIFEGTAEQMWSSLSRLARLPSTTRVYCAHEYTEANCRFALAYDRSYDVMMRSAEVSAARRRGEPTVPTTIGAERATNPFLRAQQLLPELAPAAAFAKLRQLKDEFIA